MRGVFVWSLAALTLSVVARAEAAHAGNYKVIYSFCRSGADCDDGLSPRAPLVVDASGVAYGTTSQGGGKSAGVVFAMVPQGEHWKFRKVHTLCSMRACADGGYPSAAPIIDVDGNLYGTAGNGGKFDDGVAFRIAQPLSDKPQFEVLYDFCCKRGETPLAELAYAGQQSGAPYDGQSPLYAVADEGGINAGGTVVQLSQTAGAWQAAAIHKFCRELSCTDGANPQGKLLVDADGNLFGTTFAGGDANRGTAFKLFGKDGKWKFSRIYSFCSVQGCTDGALPDTGLTQTADGTLLGTTTIGGGTQNQGVVFALQPAKNGYEEKVLHTFCAEPDCRDGMNPGAGVTVSNTGRIFGTTRNGGKFSKGAVYELVGSQLTVLHSFCKQGDFCYDGAAPLAEVVEAADGSLLGTSWAGGGAGGGSVFRLVP